MTLYNKWHLVGLLFFKVLYLLHACPGKWHTISTLSSFSFPHRRQSCRHVSPNLNITGVIRVVWPVNRPTDTLSSCLLIAWSSVILLGRGSLIRVLDWWQPLRVFHLLGAPVSNDSWWLLDPQQRGCQRVYPRILKFGWKLELQKLETCNPPFRFYSHNKHLQFLEGIN